MFIDDSQDAPGMLSPISPSVDQDKDSYTVSSS